MNKEITPEILDILRRDAEQNLTDVQRTYLLSEQGWTEEDYEKGKEHIIRTVYRGHKGRTPVSYTHLTLPTKRIV